MRIGFRWIPALAMAAVFVPQARADLIFISVSCSGCGTVVNSAASAINNLGDVVGYFSNGSATYYGFYDHQDTFTEIAVPGALYTFPQGINDNGDIVGRYYDGASWHGFLLPYGGTLETIDYGTNTMLFGINNAGEYVGLNDTSNFLWDGSSYSTLPTVPGYATEFTSINNTGMLAGAYYLPSWTGVVRLSDGTLIYPINANPATAYGNLSGINDNGVAVGVDADTFGGYHGYTYDVGTAQYTLIPDYPGSVTTWLSGINNAGTVVGYAQFADESYLAIESTPEPSGFLLMAGGALVLLIKKRRHPMV